MCTVIGIVAKKKWEGGLKFTNPDKCYFDKGENIIMDVLILFIGGHRRFNDDYIFSCKVF